jgi:mRNA interferase RelE/StbE
VYDLFVLPEARKDLDNLESPDLDRVVRKIRHLSQDPRSRGALKLTAEEGYRIRIGDYRVLYRIQDDLKRVFIYRVKHRKDAYR